MSKYNQFKELFMKEEYGEAARHLIKNPEVNNYLNNKEIFEMIKYYEGNIQELMKEYLSNLEGDIKELNSKLEKTVLNNGGQK